MAIVLGDNSYGKSEVRLVLVDRAGNGAGAPAGDRHEITDLNVSVALSGDLAEVHRSGDNAHVLPTDSQKNTVYAFARQYGVGQIEDFGLRLARHFVASQPAIHTARVRLEEYRWERITVDGAPTPHSFVRSGQFSRTATVTHDGTNSWVVSGLSGLTVLNTTDSEFRGYVKDRYTTLPETGDRILATDVDARWRHADSAPQPGVHDWGKSFDETHRLLVAAFADTYSRSLQQTLYAMGERVLAERPELAEIRLTLPNRHHFLVDLAPFGLDNDGAVYLAADRPYGLIEGTVTRDDAPPAGGAW
jgi:urate oxidase